MKDPYDILIYPIITEKTTSLKDENNQYTFRVRKDANKIEIKKAVEKRWNVKVIDVNILNMRGKNKRVGRNFGKTPSWKKAIIKLKEGDSITLFEGM